MVKEQPTRRVVRMLKDAGWVRLRTVGSHSFWQSADGSRHVSLPDGKRTISPGVYRKVLQALEGRWQ